VTADFAGILARSRSRVWRARDVPRCKVVRLVLAFQLESGRSTPREAGMARFRSMRVHEFGGLGLFLAEKLSDLSWHFNLRVVGEAKLAPAVLPSSPEWSDIKVYEP
jgi:hypothetical protein